MRHLAAPPRRPCFIERDPHRIDRCRLHRDPIAPLACPMALC
jgi:hypothetical protein